MNWLKYVDVYGVNYQFHIFSETKYRSTFGGVFSVVTLMVLILCTFIFGADFFFSRNPQTTTSKQSPKDYRYYNMSEEEFFIAWRIEYDDGREANFSELLFPMLFYQVYEQDPTTKELIYHNYPLEYKRCSEKQNATKYNMKNFYCFDLSGLKLGGDWNAGNYYFISLYFSYCPNGDNYDPVYCPRLSELNDILLSDNPLTFNFIYPDYYFQPQFKNPREAIKITYKSYHTVINLELEKEDYFFFQKVNLIDDDGLISSRYTNFSAFALLEQKTDYYYYSYNKSVSSPGVSSMFYMLNIYFSKDFEEYNRIYKKFQDVLANITCVVKIIVLVLDFFCCWINSMFLESSLIGYLFNFNEDVKLSEDRTMNLYPKGKGYQRKNHSSNNLSFTFNNNATATANINANNNSNLNMNQSNASINSSTYKYFRELGTGGINISKRSDYTAIIKKKDKEKKGYVPIAFDFQEIFFNGFLKRLFIRKKEISNDYQLAQKALNIKRDAIYYLDFSNEFQIIKHLILQEPEQVGLYYRRKSNIHSKEDLAIFFGEEMRDQNERISRLQNFHIHEKETRSQSFFSFFNNSSVSFSSPKMK